MKNVAYKAAGSSGAGKCRPVFRKLIHDRERKRQRNRLRHLQKQDCDAYGKEVARLIEHVLAEIPVGIRKAIDVPSWHVFAAILALIRCAATLKKGDGPIPVLELSAAEIAAKAGYSRSTIQAALRWLCGDPIHVWGVWVADGIGVLLRRKRYAVALVNGQPKMASRTSTIEVSVTGKLLLGLLQTDKPPKQQPRSPQRRKTKAERNVAKFRQATTKRVPMQLDERGVHQELAPEQINLRPSNDTAEGKSTALSMVSSCLNLKHFKPTAALLIFPTAEELSWFTPKQQEQFRALVAKMNPEQQSLAPTHLQRNQV